MRLFSKLPLYTRTHYLSTNFELYSHFVAFFKIFCFSDTCFDGYNITAIFGEQGSFPLGFADPNIYRNHSPAIRHESHYCIQGAGLLRRYGNEEPWGGAFPEPNFAVELDVHRYITSNAQRLAVCLARLLRGTRRACRPYGRQSPKEKILITYQRQFLSHFFSSISFNTKSAHRRGRAGCLTLCSQNQLDICPYVRYRSGPETVQPSIQLRRVNYLHILFRIQYNFLGHKIQLEAN